MADDFNLSKAISEIYEHAYMAGTGAERGDMKMEEHNAGASLKVIERISHRDHLRDSQRQSIDSIIDKWRK